MKYDELLKILRECNDCICEEHCPYHEDRNNPVKCMTKIVGDAADAIEELQKPMKWISVTERLPKLGEMVAVYMHSAIHGDEVKIDRMVISNTTDIPYWSYYKGRVKAWMPLPEPPKGETDG